MNIISFFVKLMWIFVWRYCLYINKYMFFFNESACVYHFRKHI